MAGGKEQSIGRAYAVAWSAASFMTDHASSSSSAHQGLISAIHMHMGCRDERVSMGSTKGEDQMVISPIITCLTDTSYTASLSQADCLDSGAGAGDGEFAY